jgi:hypothetical protein
MRRDSFLAQVLMAVARVRPEAGMVHAQGVNEPEARSAQIWMALARTPVPDASRVAEPGLDVDDVRHHAPATRIPLCNTDDSSARDVIDFGTHAAAGSSQRFPHGRTAAPHARFSPVWAAAGAVIVSLAAVLGALITQTRPASHGVTASVSPTPVVIKSVGPSVTSTAPPGQAGEVLGSGVLVLKGDGTAYDLDAVNKGWLPLAGQSWVAQNIMYAPTGYNGEPVIDIAGSPDTDVVMTGTGPWTYQDCAQAPYGENSSVAGLNAVTGLSLRAGNGICIETQNTNVKHDGGHIVLLVIQSVTPQEVTARVTVWR